MNLKVHTSILILHEFRPTCVGLDAPQTNQWPLDCKIQFYKLYYSCRKGTVMYIHTDLSFSHSYRYSSLHMYMDTCTGVT